MGSAPLFPILSQIKVAVYSVQFPLYKTAIDISAILHPWHNTMLEPVRYAN
jgi:hypothetical protein